MHYNRPFSLKRTELVILSWNHNICGTKQNPKDNYNVYIEIQAGCIYKTRRVHVFRGCKSIWNHWNPIFKSFSCIDNSVNKYIGILVEFLFPIGLPKESVPPFLYCLDVKQTLLRTILTHVRVSIVKIHARYFTVIVSECSLCGFLIDVNCIIGRKKNVLIIRKLGMKQYTAEQLCNSKCCSLQFSVNVSSAR